MFGRITYTTTLADTPMMSLLTVADIFALADVFAVSVPAGSLQDIFLYWGYKSLVPYYDDNRNVSKSAAGVVEISNFGSTSGFTFGLWEVLQDRGAQVNEYAILEALNEELLNGVVVSWYPDYVAFPAEYYSCIAKKRLAQKRVNLQFLFQFDFDFMILASVQVPSTVPPFVLN